MRKLWREKIPVLFLRKRMKKIGKKIIESTEHKHVDAFLCSNNIIAFRSSAGIEKTWKQVPTEIGVVTLMIIPLQNIWIPPLTVVDIRPASLGRWQQRFDK
ncbi:MAG: hypothetical protein ACLTUL_02340 [Blautia faecis]